MSGEIDVEKTEVIVEKMRSNNDQGAYRSFYYRFQPYLKNVINNSNYRQYFSRILEFDSWVDELINDTFLKAFKKIEKLDITGKPEAVALRRTKAWLGTFANNIILEEYAKSQSPKNVLEVLSSEKMKDLLSIPTPSNFPKEKPKLVRDNIEKMGRCFSKLNKVDQDILRAYLLADCINTGNRLSTKARKAMEIDFNMDYENIKKRKQRALKKLEAVFLSE